MTLRLNYDKYGKHKNQQVSEEAKPPESRRNNRLILPMTTLTPNRFLTRALRVFCCAGALSAYSVWATVARPATELDDAMARTGFDEQSVSAPSIQFATVAKGSTDVSVISTTNVGVVPVPEMSALFPIVGLIVAVSCTQILRRRRAAQQSVFRRLG